MAHLTGTFLGISPIFQRQIKEGVSRMRAEWSASSTFARKVIWPCRMIAGSGTSARVSPIRPSWLETALFTAMAVNPHSP